MMYDANQLLPAITERVAADRDYQEQRSRSRLRLAVARSLAAEGVVVEPAQWAALVRELVGRLWEVNLPDTTRLAELAIEDVLYDDSDLFARLVLHALTRALREEDPVQGLAVFARQYAVKDEVAP